MDLKTINKIEAEHISLLKEILSKHEDVFNKGDIFYKNINLRKSDTDDNDKYWSEIVVDFFYKGQLFEVLEFFIYRDGQLETKIDETVAWIKDSINDIINSVE